MENQFSRAEQLLGKDSTKKLAASRVVIFGLGGVGGYSAEALARAGAGTLGLVDSDKICLTNINRQIYATHKTIGQFKVDAAAERIAEINPAAAVKKYKLFYSAETSASVDLSEYDYIIDAVDTMSAKIELAVRAAEKNVPLISCMGAGNKLNPAAFLVADIYETSVCPVAKVMRRELRRRGVEKLKVVFSKEEPLPPKVNHGDAVAERVPGSTSFVPPVAGLILAGEVIKSLLGL